MYKVLGDLQELPEYFTFSVSYADNLGESLF